MNAYDALAGSLNGNAELTDSSNISELVEKINKVAGDWSGSLFENIKFRVLGFINQAKIEINRRTDQMTLDSEEYTANLQHEYELCKETTKEIKKTCDDVRNFLFNQEEEINEFANTQAKECAGYIRSEIYSLIDSGVTDGQNLSNAFNHIQKQKLSEFSDASTTEFAKIGATINGYFENMEDVLENEEKTKIEQVSFYKEHTAYSENALLAVFGIGGAVGVLLLHLR